MDGAETTRIIHALESLHAQLLRARAAGSILRDALEGPRIILA